MNLVTAYAAFLRGINLGGKTQLAMADLRRIAESLGWEDVRTHLNSGNLLFTSSKKPPTLSRELSAAIEQELSRSIDVAVRSRTELKAILRHNPYADENPTYVTVTFSMKNLPAGAAAAIADLATEHEPFEIHGHDVYVFYGKGQGTSKLALNFAKIVKVSTTTRNLRTVTKIVALLDA